MNSEFGSKAQALIRQQDALTEQFRQAACVSPDGSFIIVGPYLAERIKPSWILLKPLYEYATGKRNWAVRSKLDLEENRLFNGYTADEVIDSLACDAADNQLVTAEAIQEIVEENPHYIQFLGEPEPPAGV